MSKTNPFAAFSNYEFHADGSVTRNGKKVSGEASPKGEKFRLTDNDGQRKYVYGTDITKAITSSEHVPEVKSETAVKRSANGTGVTVDLGGDDEDTASEAPAKKAAAPKKTAAPKKAAAKKAPAEKKAAVPKKAAAPKAPKAKKERTFEVLDVATVKLIKKDLAKRTKLVEKGATKEEMKDFTYSALAAKYGKSNSCIVNIYFGRIHKDVEAAK